MASKGGARHIKRIAAPRAWPILRKEFKFTTKPKGSHPIEKSMALRNVIKDMLGLVDTTREADRVIKEGEVLVDGIIRKSPKFGVGLMDVVSIPSIKKHFKVGCTKKGKIKMVEITKAESTFKLCRIERKKAVKGGKIQLGLHDGRSIIVTKNIHKPGDVLKINIPKGDIAEHLKLTKGAFVYVIGGKHAGEVGKVKRIVPGTLRKKPQAIVSKGRGKTFNTLSDYVFVIGEERITKEIEGE